MCIAGGFVANLKELAEMLGLSQTTISRALNGYPEVSEDTRQRVIAAADQHNYRPNSSARRLATGKARTIGHVVPISHHDMINPHFSDFIAGAGAVYSQRGYDMLITVVEAARQADTYRSLHRDRRVDGVILHGPVVNDPRPDLLDELGLPYVVHGRTLRDETSYHWVDVNNFRSFRRATRHLLELGHRRIALINGWENMMFAQRRREGFEAALAEAGLTADPSIMVADEMIDPTAYAAMKRFLDSPSPPTAVMCSSVLSALGALRAIREHRLEPGREVSVICHDDRLSFLDASGDGLGLTTMRSGIREAGSHCANMLIDLIEGRQTVPHILLEAELVAGRTTGPPPS